MRVSFLDRPLSFQRQIENQIWVELEEGSMDSSVEALAIAWAKERAGVLWPFDADSSVLWNREQRIRRESFVFGIAEFTRTMYTESVINGKDGAK